ncbi:MAG: peptidoglycan glycosyltransferase, partial [Lachnospiraceae bacterium]|nr:peptidoglycan glycosyltransferase [Lachnospiraceae bacterium]
LNYYQKYIATIIASDVSDKTVAYVKENQSDLVGVDIEQKSIRRYNNSEAFSNVIGYTGTISTDEYEELSKDDDSYTLTDSIGKIGIEQYMNQYLRGTKGSQTVYVNSLGNLIETTDRKDPKSGGDVYLSIDADLQVNAYRLLEKEISGILLQKLANIREKGRSAKASEIPIPIYDVYNALISNGLIDIGAFDEPNATEIEREVYDTFMQKKAVCLQNISDYLSSSAPTVYKDLPKEYQEYMTYIVKELKARNVILVDRIDTEDEIHQKWTSEEASVNEYLYHCIESDWVDITIFTEQSKYVDTEELYDNLAAYILDVFREDSGFDKLVYENAILEDLISGNTLCAILFDQGVLAWDEETRNALAEGRRSAYEFLRSCIEDLSITPGQLALEPCSGSTVVMNAKTGEVLACVSYPGYDSNRLSNAKYSSYYVSINLNHSNPLYNYATQQRTAPGSTFKMCTSVAGLTEGVISTGTQIVDRGVYEKVSNHPRCWIYPGNHGALNVAGAIRHSCNYFFYEVGFRLAGAGGTYNDSNGIKRLQKYAGLLGLDEKTGVEIEENTSKIATEYPVMAAIGQSDNNITTIALARYVTAVASNGTVYNLSLLDHVQNAKGKVKKTYGSTVRNVVDVIGANEWSTIRSGMRAGAEDMNSFNNFVVDVAGKTGTAEINDHPNHALFVGFAPYGDPEITIATRIAYGYTSHNASDISRYIMGIYFKDKDSYAAAKSEAARSVSTGTSVTD